MIMATLRASFTTRQRQGALGDHLPDQADPVELEAFLARRRAAEPDKFADLSLTVVKLMGRENTHSIFRVVPRPDISDSP